MCSLFTVVDIGAFKEVDENTNITLPFYLKTTDLTFYRTLISFSVHECNYYKGYFKK